MGKDLEKCKLLQIAYEEKSVLFDSLVRQNILFYNNIETQQNERLKLQEELKQLNKDLLHIKKKKTWVIPALIGVIGGTVIGVSL